MGREIRPSLHSRGDDRPSASSGGAGERAVPPALVAVTAGTACGLFALLLASRVHSGQLTPWYTALAVAAFGIHLGVAVILALARTRDLAPRYLLALLPVLGLVNGSDPPAELDHAFDRVAFVVRNMVSAAQPGLIWAFLTVFPRRVARQRRLGKASLLLGAGLPAWVLVRALTSGAAASLDAAFHTVFAALTLLVNVNALVWLLFSMRRREVEAVRAKARLVVLPTAAYVLVLAAFQSLPVLLGRPDALPKDLDAGLSIVFPLSLVVAVSRRRLFEIDRLVRLGVAYAVVSGALLASFVGLVPWAAATAARVMPERLLPGPVATGLLAIGCFLLLQPLRRRVQTVVDRLFYRASTDPLTVLAGTLRAPPGATPRDDVRSLLERVEGALHPHSQRLWLLPAGGGAAPGDGPETVVLAPGPERETSTTVSTEALVSVVRSLPAALTPDELGPGVSLDDDLGRGCALLLPLASATGEPLGLWTLGEKRSEEPYTDSERRALELVARALALSLERRRLASRVEEDRKGRDRLVRQLSRLGGGGTAECPRCERCFDGEGVCPDDGAATTITQPFAPTLSGRFRLVRRLGSGGMGVVYLAEDEVLRREVAVKVVRDDRDGMDEALVRLRREALLLARVAHPNVVTVFDVGELPGGGAYVVMERLPGRTLQAELAGKGRLPWREAVDVLDGVLLALEAAHAVGVVHRDVKPGNVFLVDGAPRVRLVDFGLARKVTFAEGDSLAATRTGMVVGSAGYIAPELLLGDPAGPAADVFAAGVVGYEMLAGRRPFQGTTLVALHEQMACGPATPLRELVPDVPAYVADALADALRSSPEERPAGAEALRVRLRAAT